MSSIFHNKIFISTTENNDNKESKDSLFDHPKIIILGTKTTTSKQESQTARVTLNLLKKYPTEMYH